MENFINTIIANLTDETKHISDVITEAAPLVSKATGADLNNTKKAFVEAYAAILANSLKEASINFTKENN